MLTERQMNKLIATYIHHKVYGGNSKIAPYEFESDGRKQRKIMRYMVEKGFLTQTGDEYTCTPLAYNAVIANEVDLVAIWENTRHKYNYDFVLFNNLYNENKKWLIENNNKYNWYLAKDAVFYHNMQKDDIRQIEFGEVPTYNEVLVVTNDILKNHVKKVLEDERFDYLYKNNLKWALATLNIISEDEAKSIVYEDDFGGRSFGIDPDQWENKLKELIKDAEEGILKTKKRLEVMRRVQSGIEDLGGWDNFKEKMKEKLTQTIKKE